MKRSWILIIVIVLPSIAAYACGIEAWNFPPMVNFTNGDWTFGEVFVPNQDLKISFLGYYTEYFHLAFTSPHPVGLFDATGNLLRSTAIDNNSFYGDPNPPTIGGSGGWGQHFAFNWIPGITLHAGEMYVLEGVSGTDNYSWSYAPLQVYLPITVLGNNWVYGNGLNFNGTFLINDVPDGYWGPNLGTGPEPGSLVLLGTALLGSVGLARRKLKL